MPPVEGQGGADRGEQERLFVGPGSVEPPERIEGKRVGPARLQFLRLDDEVGRERLDQSREFGGRLEAGEGVDEDHLGAG